MKGGQYNKQKLLMFWGMTERYIKGINCISFDFLHIGVELRKSQE